MTVEECIIIIFYYIVQEMLERAASNGKDINRDDFYNIMTKKTF